MPTFGKRLWALRRQRGLRQEDLAAELGMTREQISYYECKATNPTVEFVLQAAEFFGTSTDELLREEPQVRKPGPVSKLEQQLTQIRSLPAERQKAISIVLELALKGAAEEEG